MLFRSWLNNERQRCQRQGRSFCLGMIDLDHFKQVNDRHGHQVGDEALTHAAQTLASGLRETDLVARWGGEEFLVVFTDTDCEAAQSVLDRIREQLKARPVSEQAPKFVRNVLGPILGGCGDRLPVSAMPCDGTFPTATTQWEKRSIAQEIPIWDAAICTQCAICPLVCPHAAIRMNVYPTELAKDAPAGFKSVPWRAKENDPYKGWSFTLQVARTAAVVEVLRSMSEARSKVTSTVASGRTSMPVTSPTGTLATRTWSPRWRPETLSKTAW